MSRRLYSERLELIQKSREAALSAVQIYNNPNTTFKTETYIVLFVIAWVYLLHAYYRKKKIDYHYYEISQGRKRYQHIDGEKKCWDLMKCITVSECPLDRDTINNLKFLIGLRNQIEHKKAYGLDSYLSARYQACALNYNFYIKALHGDEFALDDKLALSIQFAEFDHDQAESLKKHEQAISKNVLSYIADFDTGLSDEEIHSERYAYRLLFTKITAKRSSKADRVIEFLAPSDPMAVGIQKEYWVKEDREKPKFSPTQVCDYIRKQGYSEFSIRQHTLFWQKYDGKNPSKGFGTIVVKTWYWYQNWLEFILSELKKIDVKS